MTASLTDAAATAPADAASWRAEYPFASRFATVDGQRMHYVDEGGVDGGAGRPLLLVHGNPTWSFHWRRLIAALRPSHRLVAPDHIGCGLSDKPAEYPYRLERHIENLCELARHLDLTGVTLVAQDWGGAIGLGAMLRMPERFERLVLMNTGAFRAPRMPLRIRVCRTPLLGPLAVRGANAFVRAALRMAMAHPERLTPAARAGILAPYDNWAHRVAVQRFVEDIPMTPRHPTYATLLEIERGLPSLASLPTLLIWGLRDWCFTPWFLDRFAKFFPRAKVERLPDAGHWPLEDSPEQVIASIQTFLQREPLDSVLPSPRLGERGGG